MEPVRSTLITRKDIRDRFSQNLEWATGIDLATAWTTPNKSLCALQRRTPPIKVRALVRELDGTTDPDALRVLHCMGELRMCAAKFHPKVYIFHGTEKSVAWIGSANFTFSGFGENEEVLIETSDTREVEDWFDRLWEGPCKVINESTINLFANWRNNLPQKPSREPWPLATHLGTNDVMKVHRMQLLQEVNDWRSYVAALVKCDHWWSRDTMYLFSVLGDKLSYIHTICAGQELAQLPNWRNLKRCECYILRGDDRKEGAWALLGSCERTKLKSVFNPENENVPGILEKREYIHRYLEQVRAADDNEIAYVAHEVVQEIVSDKKGPFKGFGPCATTRLLALTRPDLLVSVNGGSQNGLGRLIFGEPRTSVWIAKHYDELLKWVYDQPWFKAEKPERGLELERKIWNCRAALLDAFVYRIEE